MMMELEHLKAKGLAEIHSQFDAERARAAAYYDEQIRRINHELALIDRWALVAGIVLLVVLLVVAAVLS